ncbi:MAG: FG-GAP-like repeat-containing protein [Candidatus Acidiferrales bacterium]
MRRGGSYFPKITYVTLACGVVLVATVVAAQHDRHPTAKRRPAQRAHQIAKKAAPAAADLFSTAIRANSVGLALMDRHDFTQALGRFQTACVMNPSSDTGCLNMGIALLYMGRVQDAAIILGKSAQHDPQNARAWFNLGLVERAAGNDGVAVSDFEKVASIDPDDAATQYLIGSLYLKAQQYPQAISSFRNALDLDRFDLPSEFGIAQAEGHTGDINGALEHLNRAEHLTQTGLGRPASAAYGEQGKYSLAQEMLAPIQPAPAAIPIHFVNITQASGLPWRVPIVTALSHVRTAHGPHKRTGAARTARAPAPSGPDALAKFLGSGACVFDYNNDGLPDIFLADADGKGRPSLYRNAGHGRFVDTTKSAGLEFRGEVLGCATGDYDNDGYVDLAVSLADGIQLFHNDGDGTFTDVTESAGLDERGLTLGLAFVDYNNDGDLDLYAARFNQFPLGDTSQPFAFPADAAAPGNILWSGSERGIFTDATKDAGLGGKAPSVGALECDINNDGAADVVVTGWAKSPTIYLNQREGPFLAVRPWASQMPGPTAGAVALDFDHDGWMDLAFTHWSSPGLSLWRNIGGKTFQRVQLPGPLWMRGWGLAAVDYDHDGWVDLVAVGETFSNGGRIILLRNLGGDGHGGFAGFRDMTHETGLDKFALHNPRSVIAFDAEGDGSTDLLITQSGFPPLLLKAVGSNRNNSLQLALTGTQDNRSGIGATVRIYSGAQRQTVQIGGGSGYLGQGPGEITAGVGQDRGADVVRVLWPSGVLQDDIDVLSGKRRVITESSRGPRVR